MAKDRFHDVVRAALEKEGWRITADPYEITVDEVDFEIDLAADELLAAEREGRKIAVEVKSFISIQPSAISYQSFDLRTREDVKSFLDNGFCADGVEAQCLLLTGF
ncbi:MAG: hypothetical protein HC849_15425 [Oscillatoriales cyanobacterium RU_3_3]|nr:hypothetical protein [Microcoleus sp. SU_5_6]NJL67253.1 hypothetical protein [Microcoleus sp. SM1_3_4]NJM61272.1 hypothetical protein [Oscillatoriales cyanobacterium RU_3_3]